MRWYLMVCCMTFFLQDVNAQQFEWARKISGAFNDYPLTITKDRNDNIYVGGLFIETMYFESGDSLVASSSFDGFIAKFDPSGAYLWAKGIEGKGFCFLRKITFDDDDNVYVAGDYNQDIDLDPGSGVNLRNSKGGFDLYMIKLASNGDYIWGQSFGGPGDEGLDGLMVSPDQGVYIGGTFKDSLDLDPSLSNSFLYSSDDESGFLAKYDSTGAFLWNRLIVDGSRFLDLQFASTESGQIYVTGGFVRDADFDPGAGVFEMNSLGARNVCMMKYSANGDWIWANSFDVSYANSAEALSIYADDTGFVITGRLRGLDMDIDPGPTTKLISAVGETDVFVARYHNSGGLHWGKNFGTVGDEWGSGVTYGADQKTFVIGEFSGTMDVDPSAAVFDLTSAGGTDVFVTQFNKFGQLDWAYSLGNADDENGDGVYIDEAANLYTTGSFSKTVDFDPGPTVFELDALGNLDIFIQKMKVGTISSIKNWTAPLPNIFPNPTNGHVTVDLDKHYTEVKTSIYNLSGQLLQEELHYNVDQINLTLEADVGFYLLEIQTDNVSVISYKLVKNR